MSWRVCLIGLLLFVGQGFAQPARMLPGDEPAERYLKSDTEVVSKRFLDGATTLAQWQERLPRLRREYLDMLGLWPLPPRTPLHAKVAGKLERDTVVLETLHFQSKPGLYVTANLYRPRDAGKKKLPAILYLCGHSGRGRDGNKTAFQDHGMWFARNGYVCLLLDTLQLGEIPGKHHGTYNLGRWWWHSLAYTPAGVECWNGIRGIDYLVGRPEVDPERIGVTGISGGGAATVWISAADERVKVAVPVSGMSDLESYVTNKVVNGHCDCMFLVNLYRWEWTTIAGLIAPRPMLFANSDNDRIFPMDGNRRIMARLRDAYRMHGKPDLVEEYVSVGGHDYRPDLRLAIFKWFNRHLRGDTGPIQDAKDEPLPGKQLRAFPEDSDLPKDALNGRIDESFVKTAPVRLFEGFGFQAWQKSMLDELKSGPFRNLEVVEVKKRPSPSGRTVFIEDGTTTPESLKKWLGEEPFLRVQPRGVGDSKWTTKNPPNTIERSYALLGRTVDLGRVADILGHVRAMPTHREGVRIVGRGQAGILGAYAALFEPRIREVVVVDPPSTHREGPHFLGILRHLDIPQALGLLAPRKLTLIGAGEPFETTARIYRLAGAEGSLTRTSSAQSRIDPTGIRGGVVLASNPPESVLKAFVELAGGKKARIVVLAANRAAGFEARWKPAQVVIDSSGTPNLTDATGVWLADPSRLGSCQEYLARGGLLGVSGASPEQRAQLVPGVTVLMPGEKPPSRAESLVCTIDPETALVVRGRSVTVAGKGSATFHAPASPDRPARAITLSGNRVQDLTVLRRLHRDRTAPFPPAKVGDPIVEKGSLVIVGGGGMPVAMLAKFVELAGWKKAKIVVFPTAIPGAKRDGLSTVFRRLGAEKVTVLPGVTLKEVESPEYLDALKEATGIWFGGGRQWHFVDHYEGTKLLPLMHDVLKRGGVIGGSSAGATIQGEYLCRGGVFENFAIASEGYERGFGFLPGVAIDQHFSQRNRLKDMTELMKLFPRYLGIGIDEATAIVVRGSVAEVVGNGKVYFYDRRKPVVAGQPDHESYSQGARYDLVSRKLLEEKKP